MCFLCCSVAQSCPTLCNPTDGSTTGFSVLHYLPGFLKLMSTDSLLTSSHLILCRPLLLLLSVFLSIRVFPSGSALRIRWLKYWRFSFSINPSNEYSGLISFRIDWFDLLAVQGTLKSLLQHHSLKALILQHVFSVSSGQWETKYLICKLQLNREFQTPGGWNLWSHFHVVAMALGWYSHTHRVQESICWALQEGNQCGDWQKTIL